MLGHITLIIRNGLNFLRYICKSNLGFRNVTQFQTNNWLSRTLLSILTGTILGSKGNLCTETNIRRSLPIVRFYKLMQKSDNTVPNLDEIHSHRIRPVAYICCHTVSTSHRRHVPRLISVRDWIGLPWYWSVLIFQWYHILLTVYGMV